MIPIKIQKKEIITEHYNQFRLEDDLNDNTIQAILDFINGHENLNYTFEKLLTATVSEIRSLVNIIGEINKPNNRKVFIEAHWNTLINLYSKFSSRNGRGKYSAINFVDNLNVKVCPYCNRTFIHTINRKNPSRTCQIDHFFPKDKYPYLALSFFNLIPSCYACNHTKSNQIIGLSPYEIKSTDDVITFEWEPKDAAFAYPKGDIFITPKPHPKTNGQMKTNIKVFGLEELYQNHEDVVKELLLKGEIYSTEYINSLVDSFPNLIENEEIAMRLITCNYINEEDLGKRPLAKLTRDISKEIFNQSKNK